MTPAEKQAHLRTICDLFGLGGQTRLAKLVGWHPRTMRNKLAGKTPIEKDDMRAVRDAVREHIGELARAVGVMNAGPVEMPAADESLGAHVDASLCRPSSYDQTEALIGSMNDLLRNMRGLIAEVEWYRSYVGPVANPHSVNMESVKTYMAMCNPDSILKRLKSWGKPFGTSNRALAAIPEREAQQPGELLDISDVAALVAAYDAAYKARMPLHAIEPNIDIVRSLLANTSVPEREAGYEVVYLQELDFTYSGTLTAMKLKGDGVNCYSGDKVVIKLLRPALPKTSDNRRRGQDD